MSPSTSFNPTELLDNQEQGLSPPCFGMALGLVKISKGANKPGGPARRAVLQLPTAAMGNLSQTESMLKASNPAQ